MSFWKIAWRNMQQRALASSLTALSMALGVALMIAVIVIYGVAVKQFEQSARGYHRSLRVARTLADLDGEEKVARIHIAEALSYRGETLRRAQEAA